MVQLIRTHALRKEVYHRDAKTGERIHTKQRHRHVLAAHGNKEARSLQLGCGWNTCLQLAARLCCLHQVFTGLEEASQVGWHLRTSRQGATKQGQGQDERSMDMYRS